MQTQYDAQGRQKKVLLSVNDVFERSKRATVLPLDRKTRKKIFDRYFSIVRETILSGHEWMFPDGTTIAICMEEKPGAHGISRHKRGDDGYRVKVFNPRRLNEKYSVVMKGPMLKKGKYRLERSEALRDAVTKVLFNTDTKFRLK